MYKQITVNKGKSWLLIAMMTGLLALAGYVYGRATDIGNAGLVFALLLSVGMTLVSWFAGDKIALATSGAKEISHDAAPDLYHLVENLAITAGLPTPKIYIIDDPSPNAFATGRKPENASIAVTTGLLSVLDTNELQGVLAHELSHIQNYDTRFMILVAVLVGSLTLLGDFFLRGSLFGRRSRSSEGGGNIGMIIGIVFLVLSPIIGQLIKFAISRRREYLADASGALLTRYPEGLASALEKIGQINQPVSRAHQATAHLWIANPFGAKTGMRISNLFSTHPPLPDRIRELRAMADEK
ncbi:MAG: M48 family metallopeptidase [bacterium]|nr:M48 family metallopeptidase [bacterium]